MLGATITFASKLVATVAPNSASTFGGMIPTGTIVIVGFSIMRFSPYLSTTSKGTWR